jgi:ferredoxin/flavodoxin---NADP+ reductase
MPIETADVTIVGAGPVGLFGAFYAGMRQMSVQVVDSLSQAGGQLTALYPEKYIYDMPGFPRVLAKDLAADMVTQATQFGAAFYMDQKALNLVRLESGLYRLETQNSVFESRAVIIAAGAGAFSPIRLGLPELADLEGRFLFYSVSNAAQYKGKRVLVIGGGDSAVDWCRTLSDVGAQPTLIHRRDTFRAHEESVDWLLNRSKAEVKLWTELTAANAEAEAVLCTLTNSRTGEAETLCFDAIVCALGFRADVGPIRAWGIALDGSRIPVDRFMRTNLEGVYAAGDIATYDGKLDLIATGVGEICTAVYHARTLVDPGSRFKQVHSSNMF